MIISGQSYALETESMSKLQSFLIGGSIRYVCELINALPCFDLLRHVFCVVRYNTLTSYSISCYQG